MSNSRRLAINALIRVEKDNAYSNIVLNDIIKSSELDKNDAAFLSTLFYGVLERKNTLDYYIKKLSSIPLKKISPLTLQAIRIGLYQIIYMDKVPDSAAVNESVKIIKKSSESRSFGFVNAILRNALRKLPDLPSDNSPESLSIIYSCSLSLTKKLVDFYGEEQAVAILSETLKKSSVYIRVNTLKTTCDELLEKLSQLGVQCDKTSIENALCLRGSGSIEKNQLFSQGFFHVQDLSSQICAGQLDAKPGMSVLDMCASPGGKTFTICEYMNDKGSIVACDLHEHRVKLISDGAKRLGLSIVDTAVNDALVVNDDFIEKFDRVLCDVPCSGSGIIGRKPDIRYKDFSDFSELNEIQYTILKNGFNYLKTGGKLVYSTCSILKNENEYIVERLIKEFPDAEVSFMHTYLPHLDNTDGFFVTVIEKRG